MKLNKKEIDNILDDASQYICDDLWSEFSTEWVEDYLNSTINDEYDTEDIELILEGLKDCQKEMQQEAISEEKETLYNELEEFIADSDIHLDLIDIGKVLIKLANSCLNE